MVSEVKIGMKLSTIRERMLSRIVSSTLWLYLPEIAAQFCAICMIPYKNLIYLKYLDFYREQVSAAYEQSRVFLRHF